MQGEHPIDQQGPDTRPPGEEPAAVAGELDRNRQVWSIINELHTGDAAAREWQRSQPHWGLYRIPESQLRVLPDTAGMLVVELGAGTAFLSAALARQGARVVALDLSHEQLVTAARCQQRFGPRFPLVEADAGQVPLRTGCADVVVSEHGASVWCAPQRWLAEAARLLRPGGWLVFLTNSVLSTLCVPDDEGPATQRLQRPQRGIGRTAWDGGGIEYHPSHGDWVGLLRRNGFRLESLAELYAPEDATDPDFYEIADAEWAQRWPVEDLWIARREPLP